MKNPITMTAIRLAVASSLVLSMALLSCTGERSGDGERDGKETKKTVAYSNMAPNVPLKSIDGKSVYLSEYRGKVVYLFFWATWNKECRKFLPLFENAHSRYKDNIEFLGIVTDKNGVAAARKYVSKNDPGFAVFTNGRDLIRSFGGARKLPLTVFISPDGRVMDKLQGPMGKDIFESRLSSLKRVNQNYQ